MRDIIEFFCTLWTKEISVFHQNLLLLGAVVMLFGLVSLFVKERLYLTESLVATMVGIIFGPVGLGVVSPYTWFKADFNFMLREAARLVIGFQVMAVGISTPGDFLKQNWGSVAVLLGPVTTVMWAISAICIRLALSMPWLQSMVIAACVTPTDPVLANSVVKGKFAERYIPKRLQNLLSVESGANDGLGLPFMMLPVYIMINRSTSAALVSWTFHTWIWEVCFSIVVGFACGYVARSLLRRSMRRKLIDKESFLAFTFALTFFVTGLSIWLAVDDLLALFVAGNVFAWDKKFLETGEDSHIGEVIDLLFNIAFFVFFGSIIPWRAFVELNIWRLMLAAVLILIFRRLPAVMLLRNIIPTLQSRKEAFFAGWFGPMGVGALFFAVESQSHLSAHRVAPEFVDAIFPIVCFIVLSSIIIHGITVPLTNSQLKRRMRRKIKHRKKLAAQLMDIMEHVQDGTPPGHPKDEVYADSQLDSPSSELHDGIEGVDYVDEYITDGEDASDEDATTPDDTASRV